MPENRQKKILARSREKKLKEFQQDIKNNPDKYVSTISEESMFARLEYDVKNNTLPPSKRILYEELKKKLKR